MNINRDEALRARDMAEGLMKKTDFTAARKLALKAQKMDSSLENISRMIMVCDVHCAATSKLLGTEMDWYGILQVELNADDISVKKQYKRLALLLHPDKNELPGAESAFKLITEAQTILLDRDKRRLHDIKRKTYMPARAPAQAPARPPGPAPLYKTQQMPTYHHTQPVFRETVNVRNIFNQLRPENRHPYQNAQAQPPVFTQLRPENRHPYQNSQAQPAMFSHRPTFWTSCPFCKSRFQYDRVYVNKEAICQSCHKKFTAFETPLQTAPPANGSCPTSYSFPKQNNIPAQEACSEPHKRPPTKAGFPMPDSTAKNNGKRKRKNMVECSESSDGDSNSESEDEFNDTMAARDLGSNGAERPRRSVRSKQKISYNENLNDDDEDFATELEEEAEKEEPAHKERSFTQNMPSKEQIKEDQVKTSDGVIDLDEDLSSGSEARSNLIDYEEPDFNDFETLREKSCFQEGQVWAVYDDTDGMPRFYALIKKVTTPDFKLKYVWFEVDQDKENERPNLPVSVGKYRAGKTENTSECGMFCDVVYTGEKITGRKFTVFPKKGQTWALYKNWDIPRSAESESPHKYEYEYVEILSDYAEGTTITVGFLSKVKGFTCVFCPMPKDESNTCEIPPHQLYRFSHRIPSFRLKGTEGNGVTEGWFELDPAALPVSDTQKLPGEDEEAQDEDQQSPPLGSTS